MAYTVDIYELSPGLSAWCGQGRITELGEDITDCSAVLGDTDETSEEVYSALLLAIEGEGTWETETDDGRRWSAVVKAEVEA